MAQMTPVQRILWFDCTAGFTAGSVLVLLRDWLADLYDVPASVLLAIGIVNLLYSSFSFSLATRQRSPRPLIGVLVVSNGLWAIVCFLLAVIYTGSASLFGVGHFLVEGIFVGGLAVVEKRVLLDDRVAL